MLGCCRCSIDHGGRFCAPLCSQHAVQCAYIGSTPFPRNSVFHTTFPVPPMCRSPWLFSGFLAVCYPVLGIRCLGVCQAKEADELMEEIAKKRGAKKPESESDLFAMIRAKKHSGLNALDALAAKYAPKPGSKKRRKSDPALEEPSDEEFAKIQAKVMAKKNKTKSASKGK